MRLFSSKEVDIAIQFRMANAIIILSKTGRIENNSPVYFGQEERMTVLDIVLLISGEKPPVWITTKWAIKFFWRQGKDIIIKPPKIRKRQKI